MPLPEFNNQGDLPDMIVNDDELKGTRVRIAYFEDLLAQMRVAGAKNGDAAILAAPSGFGKDVRVKTGGCAKQEVFP